MVSVFTYEAKRPLNREEYARGEGLREAGAGGADRGTVAAAASRKRPAKTRNRSAASSASPSTTWSTTATKSSCGSANRPPRSPDRSPISCRDDRLRALNEELPSPEHLPRDPRGLAALHEWTATVDGATATVAGIHYNLFLGSLVDDDVSPARDLVEFLSMDRIGTFLCTEQAHGNDAAALETVARYDRERDEFVLHTPHPGARKYTPNTSPAGGPG